MYMASNRPGGMGGLDIWVSTRESTEDPWGPPSNLGAPINTAADEFCPTPIQNDRQLLFVSTKPGGCGGSDIYVSRRIPRQGWDMPRHLGCQVNSPAEEASPILMEYQNGRRELYFSSTRPGGFAPDAPGATAGDSDIYVSPVMPDGSVATPVLALGVNTSAHDARPNIRSDGLEMVFDSDRTGGLGGFDIWIAKRADVSDAWAAPENAGANINSALGETRPFLSWDRKTLYFGTTRTGVEGAADIYFSTRPRLRPLFPRMRERERDFCK
jgi:hypothetical protein